jgi:hypothetical protein
MLDSTHYAREVYEALVPFGEPERVEEARNDKKSQLQFLAVRVPAIERVVRRGFSFYDKPAEEILSIWSEIWFSTLFLKGWRQQRCTMGCSGPSLVCKAGQRFRRGAAAWRIGRMPISSQAAIPTSWHNDPLMFIPNSRSGTRQMISGSGESPSLA